MRHFYFLNLKYWFFLLIIITLLNNSAVFSQWQTIFSDNFNRTDGPLITPWQIMEDTLFIQSHQLRARADEYGNERFTSLTDSAQTVQLRADFNFGSDTTGKFDFYILGTYIFGVGYGYTARVTTTYLELYTVVPESRLFKEEISLKKNVTYTVNSKIESSNEIVTATILEQGIELESINAPSPKRYFSTIALGIDNFNQSYSGKTIDNVLFERSSTVDANESTKLITSYFSLFQNYPNPFNPTTIIKYSIPSLGNRHVVLVQLNIYDMLGREITTLVNEEKPIGNYEVNFNGSNLSSGLYFYRLQAGSFTETKKLILMK